MVDGAPRIFVKAACSVCVFPQFNWWLATVGLSLMVACYFLRPPCQALHFRGDGVATQRPLVALLQVSPARFFVAGI
jgi:hypothetical protein